MKKSILKFMNSYARWGVMGFGLASMVVSLFFSEAYWEKYAVFWIGLGSTVLGAVLEGMAQQERKQLVGRVDEIDQSRHQRLTTEQKKSLKDRLKLIAKNEPKEIRGASVKVLYSKHAGALELAQDIESVLKEIEPNWGKIWEHTPEASNEINVLVKFNDRPILRTIATVFQEVIPNTKISEDAKNQVTVIVAQKR